MKLNQLKSQRTNYFNVMTLDNGVVVEYALVFSRLLGRVDLHHEYGVQGRVARICDVNYERIVQALCPFVLVAQVNSVNQPFHTAYWLTFEKF